LEFLTIEKPCTLNNFYTQYQNYQKEMQKVKYVAYGDTYEDNE
jgi:hypothetical protein